MSNFADAFDSDQPWVEKVNGVDVTFPLLSCDDIAKWIGQIVAGRVAKGFKRMPADASAVERMRILSELEEEPGLGEVSRRVWTLSGTRKVLSMSLEKAGVDLVAASQIIAAIPTLKAMTIAAHTSGLFEKKPKVEEGKDPNEESPEEPGENETGS